MISLNLSHHPVGLSVGPGNQVVYEMDSDTAHYGKMSTDRPALLFRLGPPDNDADISVPIDLTAGEQRLMRCDRIDFPPGGIAYRHTHPGPGIRCLLFGELTVTTGGQTSKYGPLDPWFESGPEPVLAVAGDNQPAAFVRVLILPLEWEGRRTIQYVDPEDEKKPKLQKATVYLEERVAM